MENIYKEDTHWHHAKDLARSSGYANNWLEVVSYYNETGGRHTQVFTLIKNKLKRVLLVLDDNHVLVLNKEGDTEVVGYTEAFEGRKTFYFQQEPKQEAISIPEGYEFDEQTLTIYS